MVCVCVCVILLVLYMVQLASLALLHALSIILLGFFLELRDVYPSLKSE